MTKDETNDDGKKLAKPVRCPADCRRYMYMIILVGFIVASVIKVFVAVWVIGDPTYFLSRLWGGSEESYEVVGYFISNSKVFRFNVYFLLGSNIFCLLLPAVGYIAVLKFSYRFYRLYIMATVFSSLVMVVFCFVSGGFNLLVYEDVEEIFKNMQKNEFDGYANSPNAPSRYWYTMQQNYSCCGLNGPDDYLKNGQEVATKWYNNHRNKTCALDKLCYESTDTKTVVLPASCCKSFGNGTLVNQQCPYAYGNFTNVAQRIFIPWKMTYYNKSCGNILIPSISVTLEEFNTYIVELFIGLLDCILHVCVLGFMLRKKLMRIPDVPVRRKSIAVPRALPDYSIGAAPRERSDSASSNSNSPSTSDEEDAYIPKIKPSLKPSTSNLPEYPEMSSSPRVKFAETADKPSVNYIATAYVHQNEAMTDPMETTDL